MEESDNLLITTIKEFIAIPGNVNNLKDIRTEEIFAISIKVLDHLNIDTT